jgi:hypothetical protein
MSMVGRIHNYYERQGISPTHFKCTHKADCSADCPRFVGPREPYIGVEYERGRCPRMLFLSLDVPRGKDQPKPTRLERTAARQQEDRDYQPTQDKHQSRHWYQTHDLARVFLKGYGQALPIDEVGEYFAHTNSAKCSRGNDKGAQAPQKVFDNCRPYIGNELGILQPDILVTQGKEAFKAVKYALTNGEISSLRSVEWVKPALWKRNKHKKKFGVLQIGDRKVLWFVTYHPQARGGAFLRQKEDCLRYWSTVVKRYWSPKGTKRVNTAALRG